mmetsp:Transcript_17118/g.41212  ORF Transcript_17118/g.41212 Transcript_17118/m.41212 type:complete len:256 (+) Transcript_17118:64-831(+)
MTILLVDGAFGLQNLHFLSHDTQANHERAWSFGAAEIFSIERHATFSITRHAGQPPACCRCVEIAQYICPHPRLDIHFGGSVGCRHHAAPRKHTLQGARSKTTLLSRRSAALSSGSPSTARPRSTSKDSSTTCRCSTSWQWASSSRSRRASPSSLSRTGRGPPPTRWGGGLRSTRRPCSTSRSACAEPSAVAFGSTSTLPTATPRCTCSFARRSSLPFPAHTSTSTSTTATPCSKRWSQQAFRAAPRPSRRSSGS